MENQTCEKRTNRKTKMLTDGAMTGLKIFASGAISGLGMRFGANLYDRFKSKNYRASVSDLRSKQG